MQKEVSELWQTLLAAAKDKKAHAIMCILDALDECKPADRQQLIGMLARFHEESRYASSANNRSQFKIVVTSRPYNDIKITFKQRIRNVPAIRLRREEENGQIRNKINSVVSERVERLAQELHLEKSVSDRLETKLLGMEHRTYLWLYLALESFATTMRNSPRPEDEAIEMLPSTFNDAYEKILCRVSPNQKDMVRQILQIVVGCRRALTVPEMAIALSVVLRRTTRKQKLGDVSLRPE